MTKPEAGVIATSPEIAPEQNPFRDILLVRCQIISVNIHVAPPTLAERFVTITAFTARELIENSLPPV